MDIEKLTQVAARAARDALNADGTFDVRSPDECSLDDQEQGEWDATVRATSAVLAIALAAAADVAKGPYASTSKYDDQSVYYGSDINPDRSEFGRGKQAGREAASSILRTIATLLGAANG